MGWRIGGNLSPVSAALTVDLATFGIINVIAAVRGTLLRGVNQNARKW